MTVLVDWQIQERCEKGLVIPFDPELINPSSLDVRVGTEAKLRKIGGWIDINLSVFIEPLPRLEADGIQASDRDCKLSLSYVSYAQG